MNEIREYNQSLFDIMKKRYPELHIGFFHGNNTLLISQSSEIVSKKRQSMADAEKEYFDAVKRSPFGKFIGQYIKDWNCVSLTPVIKVPVKNDGIPSYTLHKEFVPIIIEQLKLLKPKHIICVGQYVGSIFGLTEFYKTVPFFLIKEIEKSESSVIPLPAVLLKKKKLGDEDIEPKLRRIFESC